MAINIQTHMKYKTQPTVEMLTLKQELNKIQFDRIQIHKEETKKYKRCGKNLLSALELDEWPVVTVMMDFLYYQYLQKHPNTEIPDDFVRIYLAHANLVPPYQFVERKRYCLDGSTAYLDPGVMELWDEDRDVIFIKFRCDDDMLACMILALGLKPYSINGLEVYTWDL